MTRSRFTRLKIYFAQGQKGLEHGGVRPNLTPDRRIRTSCGLAVKFGQHAVVGKIAAFHFSIAKNGIDEQYAQAQSDSVPKKPPQNLHSSRSSSVKG